jgi:hypothetical protein
MLPITYLLGKQKILVFSKIKNYKNSGFSKLLNFFDKMSIISKIHN